MRGLYATIKSCDAQVRFCFLTGVSEFSEVSLFPGLNNLIGITLEPPYSAICGYTEADLETVLAPELPGLDRERVRDWHNGYGWGARRRSTTLSTRCCCSARASSRRGGFETGTPTFLVETLADRGIASATLDGTVASEKLLSTFDVSRIATEALLFQTGYLTVLDEELHDEIQYYRLGYPNREVRQSFNESLLDYLTGDASRREANSIRLYDLLQAADFAGLEQLFRAFFASIPYGWHRHNEIARYEGYYASVFYSYFAGAGAGREGGGERQSGAAGHGGAGGGPGVPIRVQGAGAGGAGDGHGAVAGAGLRGQVPPLGRGRASRGGGVQRGDMERDGVRS